MKNMKFLQLLSGQNDIISVEMLVDDDVLVIIDEKKKDFKGGYSDD